MHDVLTVRAKRRGQPTPKVETVDEPDYSAMNEGHEGPNFAPPRYDTPGLPDHDEIKAWLLSKGIAAWGQIFTTIEGKDSLDLAATWIQGQIDSFLKFRARA